MVPNPYSTTPSRRGKQRHAGIGVAQSNEEVAATPFASWSGERNCGRGPACSSSDRNQWLASSECQFITAARRCGRRSADTVPCTLGNGGEEESTLQRRAPRVWDFRKDGCFGTKKSRPPLTFPVISNCGSLRAPCVNLTVGAEELSFTSRHQRHHTNPTPSMKSARSQWVGGVGGVSVHSWNRRWMDGWMLY